MLAISEPLIDIDIDDQADDILLSIPKDRGCAYYAKCLTCPLFDCYSIYESVSAASPKAQSQTALNRAITHSWERGLRHPTFWWLFTGDFHLVPDDVYADHGGRSLTKESRGVAPEEVGRIQLLRDQGYTHDMIGALTGRSRTGIISILKRYRAA